MLFVDLSLVAHLSDKLKLGNISIDGSKIHADASKNHAVSYKRLQELQAQFRQEIDELFTLASQSEGEAPLDTGAIEAEIARRQAALVKLAEAKQVIEVRAQERHQQELSKYAAKLAERKARGAAPQPPQLSIGDKEQYYFIDIDRSYIRSGSI